MTFFWLILGARYKKKIIQNIFHNKMDGLTTEMQPDKQIMVVLHYFTGCLFFDRNFDAQFQIQNK